MAEASPKFYSRRELLTLSREELVAIILREQTDPAGTMIVGDNSHPGAAFPFSNEYDVFCRQVAKNYPNGSVAILDRQFTYVHVAGQDMQRFGLTEKDFIGRSMGVIVSGEQVQELEEKMTRVFEGETCKMELTIGGEVYLIEASPLMSDGGTIDHLLTISQNITQRKNAIRQARESEAQFQTLAENIPGAVYIASNDVDRRVVYVSGKIEDFCGYPPDDFLQGAISSRDLMHPEDHDSTKVALKKAVIKGEPYHLIYRWRHRDGHYCWIEEYGTHITKDNKQYLLGVMFDISEKKNYEKELQQQNEDLKKANAELDHFAYSVSHDLRAPLTSAMGLLRLLKVEQDPTLRDHFSEVVQQSLTKLDHYIQDIIHLTKNARTELDVAPVNLKEMIDEVVTSQQQNANEEGVAVYAEVRNSQEFHTDARRLWIVLNNLVSNAIRYHFPLREQSYVRIVAEADSAQLTLTVEDNGIGIQPEHLDKIFDMFYRATDRKVGSGLGLYLVKETIDRLGGKVRVTSVYEQGTTFVVRLPSLPPAN